MRFELIEFHDAELASLRLERGELVLGFAHIALYEPLSPERYAVWSYTGTLRAIHATDLRLRLASVLPEDIVDLEIDGMYPGTEAVPKLLGGADAKSLRFVLGDGSEAQCQCEGVCFDIGTKVRRLKDWTGPLVSAAATPD